MEKGLNYVKHNMLKECIIRKDHYDGQNALYRLSAVIYLRSNENGIKVQHLIENSKGWKVPPSEMVVFSERIEIHWYTIGYQMILNHEQYLELIRDYIIFLNSIDDLNISFLERCLIESPDCTVWGVPNEIINFKPGFNSKCFGLGGLEINVVFLTERLESVG